MSTLVVFDVEKSRGSQFGSYANAHMLNTIGLVNNESLPANERNTLILISSPSTWFVYFLHTSIRDDGVGDVLRFLSK